MFFGLSAKEFRKLAYEFAEKLGIVHRFNNDSAGKTWMRLFLSRHPELVIRSPELICIGMN